MKLVPKDSSLLEQNINHRFGISQQTQEAIRIGTAQYIVELGKTL
jgi:hypothetical protein